MTDKRPSTLDEINEKLVAIWDRHRDEIEKKLSALPRDEKGRRIPFLCPLQYPEFKPGGVLFVGFNPSFSHRGWRTVLKKSGDKTKRLDEAVEQQFSMSACVASAEIKRWEKLAHEHLEFFRYHRDVEKEFQVGCPHVDLFAWRQTKQGKARVLLVDKGAIDSDFSKAQLDVFDDLLDLAKPRAVVVTNALASEIYLKRRPARFDPAKGCYIDTIADASVPVLLGGMLTGQRAMDRYSRQRLLWRLGQILDSSKKWIPLATPNKKDPDAIGAVGGKTSSTSRRKP